MIHCICFWSKTIALRAMIGGSIPPDSTTLFNSWLFGYGDWMNEQFE